MSNILIDLWDTIKINLFRMILIAIGLTYFRPIDFYKLVSIFIFVNTLIEILTVDELDFNKWIKKTLLTILILSVLYLAFWVGGWFGVIGIAIATIVMLISYSVWVVYANWKLMKSTVTWAIELKKDRKDFNLKEAIKDGERKKRKRSVKAL